MRRAIALVLSFGAWVALAGSAGAAITTNTFGGNGQVAAGGHRATIDVLIACTDDGAVRFTVTLTQGDTVGVGHGGGVCTGQQETYTVTVTARGGTFVPGDATACGEATNRDHGGDVDSSSWCRATPITLS